LGFDTIELNVGSLGVPEETLLRFVRLVKTGGMKAKPHFELKFNKSDIPRSGDRAYGAYILPAPRSSGKYILLSCSFSCSSFLCIHLPASLLRCGMEHI
jgi:hypothetical protein